MATPDKRLFLRWLLVNVLFVVGLLIAKLNFHGHIPSVSWAAIIAVLAIFGIGSGYAGIVAWKGAEITIRVLDHIDRAADYCPKVAMLGTVSGFLIALGAGDGDAQQRLRGAATALAATFVGIVCMLFLNGINHIFEGRRVASPPA